MLVENTRITRSTTTKDCEIIESSSRRLGKNVQKTTDHNIAINLLSGAMAGGIAKTCIAPLDLAKINFQIHKDTPYSSWNAVKFLHNVYVKEGFFALWRGNSATMARIIPYAAIQFISYDQYRKVLRVDRDESTGGRRFLAGSLAGITTQTFTYPLDLARARMSVIDKNTGYKSLRHVFVKIWIDEGPRTLLRGYWVTILGVIPYAGTSFFTFETLKRKHSQLTGEKKPHALVSLGYGAIAGVIGQATSYPFEIVRRRMQTSGMMKHLPDNYETIYSSMKTIYNNEGIRKGFFKGLSMNWIKGPIAISISFTTYENVKEFLQNKIVQTKIN